MGVAKKNATKPQYFLVSCIHVESSRSPRAITPPSPGNASRSRLKAHVKVIAFALPRSADFLWLALRFHFTGQPLRLLLGEESGVSPFKYSCFLPQTYRLLPNFSLKMSHVNSFAVPALTLGALAYTEIKSVAGAGVSKRADGISESDHHLVSPLSSIEFHISTTKNLNATRPETVQKVGI